MNLSTLTTIASEKSGLWIGTLIGVAMAAFAFVSSLAMPLMVVVAIASGPAVAVYGSLLFVSRDERHQTALKGLLLILVGTLHLFWLVAIIGTF